MSMNLYIESNNKKVKGILQTPTHITYMCVMTENGIKNRLKGKEAKRALLCYLEYVKSLANGAWKNTEIDQYNSIKTFIEEQKELINSILDSKNLIVYVV